MIEKFTEKIDSFATGVLLYFTILFTIPLALVAVLATLSGQFESASRVASVASVLISILLVAITAEYTRSTRELVKETKEAREEESKRYQRERESQKESLRIALLAELLSMQPAVEALDHQLPLEGLETTRPEYFLSNNVYDGNTDQIGLLSGEEAKSVVEYYTNAAKVQAVGSRDPENIFIETAERDLYSKLFRAIEALEDKVEKQNFGREHETSPALAEKNTK